MFFIRHFMTIMYFNPHHRTGGDKYYDVDLGWLINFNPHHRTGGDTMISIRRYNQNISIHTTARVVTSQVWIYRDKPMISIHTTARVVTRSGVVLQGSTLDFNPHHRTGGD